MKVTLIIATVALLAAGNALVFPQKLDSIIDRIRCALCQDVIRDIGQWVTGDVKANEKELIEKCEKALGGVQSELAKLVCDDFIKNGLEDLLAWAETHAVDPNDIRQTCVRAEFCPAGTGISTSPAPAVTEQSGTSDAPIATGGPSSDAPAVTDDSTDVPSSTGSGSGDDSGEDDGSDESGEGSGRGQTEQPNTTPEPEADEGFLVRWSPKFIRNIFH